MHTLRIVQCTSTFKHTNIKMWHMKMKDAGIPFSRSGKKPRSRLSTYPVLGSHRPPKLKASALPPPLEGCTCSECNSRQSLGAITFGKPTNAITK